MNRVIIAGGRNFNDTKFFVESINSVDFQINEIVCGGASGADALGEEYAKENGVQISYFHADWKGCGKAAGPIRNTQMANHGTHLIAFWDGVSKGTKNMIDLAKKNNLCVIVFYY